MPERYEGLRLRLHIEYGRLLDWGDAAGITEAQSTFDKKMQVNGGTVMALLSEMRSLLKKMRAYSLRYDDLAAPFPQEAKGHPRLQAIDTVNMKEYRAIFESKDIPKDKRKYPKGLNRLVELASGVKAVAKHPKRLLWATFDENAFKADLERIRSLTNFLHETLGDHQMKMLMETTRETYMAVLQLSKNIRQIKMVAEVAPGPHVEDDDNASIFSQAETLVEGRYLPETSELSMVGGTPQRGISVFEQLANFRAVNASLYSSKTTLTLEAPVIDRAKDLTDELEVKGNHIVTAIYQKKNVWVEWKTYQRDDAIETPTSLIYQISPKVKQDAERLVGLLRAKEKPAEFCVPDCAGYFDDAENDRFGFVYEVRDKVLSTFQPRSLLELLRGSPAPLQARVALAQRLTTCLLYLHATNWLHKALRSASILFFSETNNLNLSSPYISSFEYSRPDKNDATFVGAPEKTEWAIYCHPEYLGRPGPFRKSYDIYSLGIILLEIAYWKPAAEIFGIYTEETEAGTSGSTNGMDSDLIDMNGASDCAASHETTKEIPMSPVSAAASQDEQIKAATQKQQQVTQIRNWILLDASSGGRPRYLEHVRNTMGSRYHNAVKACIGGMDYFHLPSAVDQTDPVIATLLQQAYLRLVVDVLSAIVV